MQGDKCIEWWKLKEHGNPSNISNWTVATCTFFWFRWLYFGIWIEGEWFGLLFSFSSYFEKKKKNQILELFLEPQGFWRRGFSNEASLNNLRCISFIFWYWYFGIEIFIHDISSTFIINQASIRLGQLYV